jgi:hypothetical protein
MSHREATGAAPQPKRPFWRAAALNAVVYYPVVLFVEWGIDAALDDPFDLKRAAIRNVFAAVFFGVLMAWLPRRAAVRRE